MKTSREEVSYLHLFDLDRDSESKSWHLPLRLRPKSTIPNNNHRNSRIVSEN